MVLIHCCDFLFQLAGLDELPWRLRHRQGRGGRAPGVLAPHHRIALPGAAASTSSPLPCVFYTATFAAVGSQLPAATLPVHEVPRRALPAQEIPM